MNKHLSRLLALCLALIMALSASFAMAENDLDAVVASVDGENITVSELQAYLDYLVSQDYAQADDYSLALEHMIEDKVKAAKIKELGLDQFTAEEEESIKVQAAELMENAINNYVSYYLTDDTEEARAQLREQAAAYYEAIGVNEEYAMEYLKEEYVPYVKLEEYALKDKDLAVTEEEIRAEFEETANIHKQYLEGNVATYEVYQMYYGSDYFWYVPEGYRGIIHILLKVDDELLTAYQDAQAAYEESVTEEAPEGDEALKAARDEAYNAVMVSKQAEIDDIYARLEKGESFTDLIAQYGEDTGMKDESKLASGYDVHKDSMRYDPVFTACAFSDKMQKPGDYSDPVITSYGIHILYYLRDIPGGIIEMTDAIRDEIEQSLLTNKQYTALTETLTAWTAEHDVVRYQEVLDQLTVPADSAE